MAWSSSEDCAAVQAYCEVSEKFAKDGLLIVEDQGKALLDAVCTVTHTSEEAISAHSLQASRRDSFRAYLMLREKFFYVGS